MARGRAFCPVHLSSRHISPAPLTGQCSVHGLTLHFGRDDASAPMGELNKLLFQIALWIEAVRGKFSSRLGCEPGIHTAGWVAHSRCSVCVGGTQCWCPTAVPRPCMLGFAWGSRTWRMALPLRCAQWSPLPFALAIPAEAALLVLLCSTDVFDLDGIGGDDQEMELSAQFWLGRHCGQPGCGSSLELSSCLHRAAALGVLQSPAAWDPWRGRGFGSRAGGQRGWECSVRTQSRSAVLSSGRASCAARPWWLHLVTRGISHCLKCLCYNYIRAANHSRKRHTADPEQPQALRLSISVRAEEPGCSILCSWARWGWT